MEAYIAERPSAEEGGAWLLKLGFERIVVREYPLEVAAGHGQALLEDPLLRGGLLDDVYECCDDSHLADEVMTAVAEDVLSFAPLVLPSDVPCRRRSREDGQVTALARKRRKSKQSDHVHLEQNLKNLTNLDSVIY